MAGPSWKFVVVDLKHQQIGELVDYYDMNISRRMNGIDTGSFKVRAGNPLFTTLASQKCMVKAYRNNVLQAYMYVWAAEITGDPEKISLAVTLSAPAVRLDETYITWGAFDGPIAKFTAPADRLQTFQWLHTRALLTDSAAAGLRKTVTGLFRINPETGLDEAVTTPDPSLPLMVPSGTVGSTYTYDDTDDRAANAPISARLQRFSQGAAGFDWYWNPTEASWWYTSAEAGDPRISEVVTGPESYTWVSVSSLAAVPLGRTVARTCATMVAASKMGTNKPNVKFEYGVGANNLTGFKLSATRQYQSNFVCQPTPNSKAFTYVSAQPGRNNATWGAMPSIAQYDTADTTYLTQLLNGAGAIRQVPLRRLEITPVTSYGAPTDPPSFGTDFNFGDAVTARIIDPATSLTVVDGLVRVHGVSWTLKDSGAETMSITISPDN